MNTRHTCNQTDSPFLLTYLYKHHDKSENVEPSAEKRYRGCFRQHFLVASLEQGNDCESITEQRATCDAR